jgi:hypothetical protein
VQFEWEPDYQPQFGWQTKNLIPQQGVIFVAGQYATCKTNVLLDWMMSNRARRSVRDSSD